MKTNNTLTELVEINPEDQQEKVLEEIILDQDIQTKCINMSSAENLSKQFCSLQFIGSQEQMKNRNQASDQFSTLKCVCKFERILEVNDQKPDIVVKNQQVVVKEEELFLEYPPLNRVPVKRMKFPVQVSAFKVGLIILVIIMIGCLALNPELFIQTPTSSNKGTKQVDKKDLKKK